jgi:hypothetical protein
MQRGGETERQNRRETERDRKRQRNRKQWHNNMGYTKKEITIYKVLLKNRQKEKQK